MKVTVCQYDPSPDALDAGLEALKDHLAAEQSDFLLLPEMSFSAWLAADPNPDPARWAAAVDTHAQRIANLADLGVPALLGTRPIINAAGSRRNEAYVWTRETGKAAGFHEKYYLPDEPGYWEHSWYDRGLKHFDTARAGGLHLGLQICTEMWFFEWARHFAQARVDVLAIPRATPNGTTDKWLAGGRTAAVCSGAYCLSSNLWAPKESGADLGGLGWIIDPEGTVIATTTPETPFATAEIDLAAARSAKRDYPRYVPE